MDNRDKIQQYFEREHVDFDASYSNPKGLKDIVRRASYWYGKKAIEGRLTALINLVGDDIKDKDILEVGYGPGYYSIGLAKKGAKITGIDYAKSMADIAKSNAKKANVEIDFKVADFLADDIDGDFDYVFATGVIEYIEPSQQELFLKKMTAVSNDIVIVSFPKRYVAHAFIREIWLRVIKKIRISFFVNKDISRLSSACGLKEIDRIDVGILWVIKFKKSK